MSQSVRHPVSQSVSQLVSVIQVVPLGTFIDNIDVDVVTGHLWVAGYPDALKVLKYMMRPHTTRAPSQVEWTPSSRITTDKLVLLSKLFT